MSKTVSFHKHEVAGVQKTKTMLTRMGVDPNTIKDVSILVRNHQYRFYQDTKDETIIKWMRKLGKDASGYTRWKKLMLLRLYDRAGNDKNKSKPLVTKEWKELWVKCEKLNKGLVYFEDLVIDEKELIKLKVPTNKIQEALSNMIGIVQSNVDRNNKKYLKDYIKRNYGAKK